MSASLACPSCANSLQLVILPGSKAVWRCPSCSGVALNLSVLRAEIDARAAAAFWNFARSARPSTRPCPSCRNVLRQVHHNLDSGSVEIDLCTRCQMVWFDRGELERFGRTRPPRPQDSPPRRISKPPPGFSMEPVLPEADYPVIEILEFTWEIISGLISEPLGQ